MAAGAWRGDPERACQYYRARYYDPTLGRFISEDPIGLRGDGPNFYAYVMGNPIRHADPWGYGVFLPPPPTDQASCIKQAQETHQLCVASWLGWYNSLTAQTVSNCNSWFLSPEARAACQLTFRLGWVHFRDRELARCDRDYADEVSRCGKAFPGGSCP
jgi:RHS repeat-associated protein